MTHTSTEQPEFGTQSKAEYVIEIRNLKRRIAELEAAQAQRVRLSDAEALKLLKSGPVYAPNGEVNLRPLEYRREIENARLRGFRVAERTYGITQEKQG